MKLAILGYREFNDGYRLAQLIDRIIYDKDAKYKNVTLITEKGSSISRLASVYARQFNCKVLEIDEDGDRLALNDSMVDQADVCLLFYKHESSIIDFVEKAKKNCCDLTIQY